ncbi:MAG: ExbD/TolR family protein [bacterium]
MARRSATTTEDDLDVNITPLLDIVFIMLIFFIVTATFIKEPGVDILRPEAVTANRIDQISLLVGIDANDKIWINKEEVDLNEVRFKVEELRRETPLGNAVIQVDEAARSELMLDVLKEVRDAGVDEVSVATEK